MIPYLISKNGTKLWNWENKFLKCCYFHHPLFPYSSHYNLLWLRSRWSIASNAHAVPNNKNAKFVLAPSPHTYAQDIQDTKFCSDISDTTVFILLSKQSIGGVALRPKNCLSKYLRRKKNTKQRMEQTYYKYFLIYMFKSSNENVISIISVYSHIFIVLASYFLVTSIKQ